MTTLPRSGKIFVDTNIFVYAADADTPDKQAIAQTLVGQLFDQRRGTVSTQVLVEAYNAFFRKLSLAKSDARALITAVAQFEVIPSDVGLVDAAMVIHQVEPLSFWDALIVAAASTANCGVLLTEDMNDGQTISGVRIVNPFVRR